MSAEQIGRTAPWAKALGAVVLALLAAIIIAFIVTNSQEADRERAAFEDTRLDAERFADFLTTLELTPQVDRQDLIAAQTAAAGPPGVILAVAPTDGHTRVVAQFSRPYRLGWHLGGTADGRAHRCFTIDIDTQTQHSQLTAHDTDTSCRRIANELT